MRNLILFFTFLCTCSNLSGQSNSVFSAKTIIPPSPTVGSLLKFVENPVSQFTGLPQISIPIHTIETGKVKMPVYLSYHAGGVRVTEAASWVGMSWALNAGGVISQSIRGIRDDAPQKGRFNTTPRTMNNIVSPTLCDLQAIADGFADNEPDIFSFTFNGKSGQFYIADDKSIVQIPEQKLKIEVVANDTPTDFTIYSWKITDLDGTQYLFTAVETLMSLPKVVKGTSLANDADIGNYPQEAQKSWMLTKILQTNGQEINFAYDDYSSTDYIFSSEYKEFGQNGTPNACTQQLGWSSPFMGGLNYQKQMVATGKRLKSITYSEGKIEFVAGGNRCDIYGEKFLDKVILYNYKNEKIKEVDLQYKYFVGTNSYTTSSLNCSTDPFPDVPHSSASANYYKDRRLFLTSVDELDANSSLIGTYTFDYENSIGLPNRFSTEQDWWGFYNGNGYTSLLQNLFQINQYLDYVKRYTVYGRNPSLNYAKQGNLKKITYPTGGYSEFEYELNSLKTTYAPTSVLHEQVVYNASGTSSGTFLGNITVNDVSGSAVVPFKVDQCVYGPNTNSLVGFYITDMSGNTIISGSQVLTALQSATLGEVNFTLNTGQYKIYSYASGPFLCNYNITIKRWVDQPPAQDNYDVGGLRIKKITSFDPVAGKTLQKSYQYTELINGVQKSTGINSLPLDNFRNEYATWKLYCLTTCGDMCVLEHIDRTLILNSNTNYPLGTNQGGSIGYSKVIEKIVDQSSNDLGYTLYEYTNTPDAITGATPVFLGQNTLSGNDKYPWEPVENLSWLRGKPLKIEQYVNNGGNYSLLKKQTFTYTSPNLSIPSTKGTVVSYSYRSQHPDLGSSCPMSGNVRTFSGFRYVTYQLNTGCSLLASSVSEEKDALNNTVSVTTSYQYNPDNLLPSSITTTNSLTGSTIQTFKYPKDYLSITATDPVSAGIKALQTAYVIDKPIEQRMEKVINNVNQGTVSAVFNSYKSANSEPDKIYATEFTAPVTNFTSSSVVSGAVSKDSRYQERVSFNLYDNTGNLVEQQVTNNIKQSYIWGYSNNYPIAEVKNAAVKDVFHTSFEDADGNSTTGDSKTGRLSRLNSYTKALTGLTNGNYLLTYWKKVSGAWALQSSTVTVSSTTYTISLTGQVDEVRFYPANAFITTYTYDPLIGITSQCDVNNRLVYYQYDAFNRLSLVIDQDNNILKKYCYNYAGQAENCTYTLPMWQNTATAIRCKKDGNNQNMGDQEQEQKDMNPSSPTYNQLRWIVIGTNLTSCPIPPPCTGPDKMIINGVCVTGTKRYTASVWSPSEGKWSCKYKYTWQPDCVSSIDYYELKTSPCTSAPACIPD